MNRRTGMGDVSVQGPFEGQGRADNRVSVPDPNNPGRMIWVDAIPNEIGDLVPADPRYQLQQGPLYGNPSAGSSNATPLLVVGVLVALFLISSR